MTSDAEQVEADRLMEQWPPGIHVAHSGMLGVTTGAVKFFFGIPHVEVLYRGTYHLMFNLREVKRLT